MSNPPPVEYTTVPERRYPFHIAAYPNAQALDVDPVWETTVTGPGALRVPALKEKAGGPVRIVIRYADGTVERSYPDTDE